MPAKPVDVLPQRTPEGFSEKFCDQYRNRNPRLHFLSVMLLEDYYYFFLHEYSRPVYGCFYNLKGSVLYYILATSAAIDF
jgi:hypothetical protein